METIAGDLSTMVRTPLHDAHVAAMHEVGVVQEFPAGAFLQKAGDPQSEFHYVIAGAVAAIDPRTGGQYGAQHLGPPQFFGEISFLAGGSEEDGQDGHQTRGVGRV